MKTKIVGMGVGVGILAAAAIAIALSRRNRSVVDRAKSYGKHKLKTMRHTLDGISKDLKTRLTY